MADEDPLAGTDDQAKARGEEVPGRGIESPDLEAQDDEPSVIEERIEEVKQKAREMAEGDRS